jgi:hypothetical protein
MLAVYRNKWGQVVILERNDCPGDEDKFVIVGPAAVPNLIARIKRVAEEIANEQA